MTVRGRADRGAAPRSARPLSPSLQRLARSGTLNLAGTLAGGAATIALVVVVTNGFPQDVAGTLFAATSFFLIVSAISGLGTDVGLAHTIQRQLAKGSRAGALATVRIALRAVIAMSFAAAIAVWILAPWLGALASSDADPATMTAMLRVLAVALPVASAYDTVLAATRAHGTMRPNVVVEKLGRLPGQILCVLVVWALGLGPVALAVAWVAPYFLGLIGVSWWYRSIVASLKRADLNGAGPDGAGPDGAGPHAALAREFWAFTIPRAFGRICQVALQRADIVLVAALLTPRHAAVYTAATRFLVFGQLGIQAIQQVLAPQLSGMFARGDLAGVRRVFATSTAWLMAISWPIYLTSAVAAPALLQVFGGGYAAGHATVVILAITMLATTATGSVDVVLLMAGRSRQSLVNNALALVVDVGLVVLLVPWLGITGAAVAWAAALGVRNVLPMIQVRRAFGVMSLGPGTAWVAGSAGLCFGVIPLLLELVLPDRLPVIAVWLALMCVTYAALLWRGRHLLELSALRSVLPTVSLGRKVRRLARVVVVKSVARLRRLPLPHRLRVALSTLLLRKPGLTEVPLDRLLLGAQDGVPVADYAREFDDLLWASTPVPHGPHAALLRLAAGSADTGPTSEAILESAYGAHARRCVRLTGRYFWASDDAGIVEVARTFLARGNEVRANEVRTNEVRANGGAPRRPDQRNGQSTASDPVLVAPIRDSDCFQVLDGHHRLAILAHRGAPSAKVKVKRVPVTTPLQDLLGQMSWIGGKKELYQPLDAPELQRGWTTVRRCTDRMELMNRQLATLGIERAGHSYLDVASCYGWFVRQFARRGFAAEGVERDPLAPRLGAAVYGLDPQRISVGDAVEFLRNAQDTGHRWDVVSCFSLLHHFVLGRGSTTAEELARLLDGVSARVLFLDTGQDHEAWFARSLAGWNAQHIGNFLRCHTTFDEIIDLGPDQDAIPPYADNYGRHLFACVRTPR
ncbi:polysaccharide biosynthesis C-terminal domain-containing protein [Actinopolymorpha alba]|uniref:polysaccharide biosynthesis C-terminal domain-containing protein n=1 Tax=Actinopolymorpha alba TaxID=533267 RepID=UPI0003A5BC02|nr:polysaccharide biosynthesis C-terminal domain-containing protein [Actinopolymorpha alba]